MRRQIRTMWVAAFVAIVAPLALQASLSAQQGNKPGGGGGKGGGSTSYTIVKLDDGKGAYTGGAAYGINDLGLVVGYVEDPASPRAVAAAWAVNGTDSQVQPLIGGVHARGVNNFDAIVGFGVDENDFTQGLYWVSPASKPIALPPLDGGLGSAALAINDDGLICGYSFHAVKDGEGQIRPATFAVVWSVAVIDGEFRRFGPVLLPILEETSIAHAVSETDEDGFATVVGGFQQLNGPRTAAVAWTVLLDSSGKLIVAHKPQLLELGEAQALGVNNIGMSCGASRLHSKAPTEARVWIDGIGITLDPNRQDHVEALGANDNGVIVGMGGPTTADLEAFVWPHATARPVVLNKFLPKKNSPFAWLKEASAINEAGLIVGGGWGTTKSYLPFLAIPK
jgi:uncharacterized membrane protein